MSLVGSLWPWSIRDLGVSGRKNESRVMMMFSMVVRPRLMHYPSPNLIFSWKSMKIKLLVATRQVTNNVIFPG
ncbi:hypothetical protein QJS10_CPA05g01408 [Acorus calamus]|uniref:Uncharacterized protein n=1 Tax=Acorus calamus TaxID=4465 RepID=A0AAV9ERZ4_ACOCL|nr:hypothetical protein QJS10_CPA05g01408 [Acorus calamus]